MTYQEKLKDPRWQKKRLEVLNRDNFTCQLCETVKIELHVHHLSYGHDTEPWDYDDSNFITYCKVCHKVVEFTKKEKWDIQILKGTIIGGSVEFLVFMYSVIFKQQEAIMFFEYESEQLSFRFISSADVLSRLIETFKINTPDVQEVHRH